MMQAVILAAGVGSRLRPLTDTRPKTLVPIGGAPILGHTLGALVDSGIKSVVVVTGYRREAVDDYLRRRSDVTWVTVENPAYDSTNTLASLLVAAPVIEGDFLLLDGDLVLEPAVISRMLEPGTRLAVDTSVALDDDAVKVGVFGGQIVLVGKTLPPCVPPIGESIGIARIDEETWQPLLDVGRRLLAEGGASLYYEAAFQALIDRGHRFEVADITGLRWVEIDDREDLQRAETLFAL